MKRIYLLLTAIILLSSVLRLWQLDKYPSGLNADEAAIGYNVYSLLTNGRDEAGNKWPVNFQSFGDWKPGGYFYLTLPFVKILGLNEWAVRLPSALMGILAVYLIYLLSSEIFVNKKIGIINAFILSISPWHIHFSRGGWETNAATTLILLGVYLFTKSLNRPKIYIFSFLSFLASMYTYHSARIIAPLILVSLFIIYWKAVSAKFKTVVISSGVSLIVSIPLLISLFSTAGISRFSGVGLFSDTGPIARINELRGEHISTTEPVALIFHNKAVVYSLKFLENYFSHFSGDFLFVNGDVIQRNKVPGMGLLYFLDLFFLPLGLFFLIKKISRNNLIILLWLIIAAIASSLTYQAPNAIRALNIVIPITLISSYGFYCLSIFIKEKFSKLLFAISYLLLAIIMVWNISHYLHQYYVHYPQEYPSAWEYGFKDLANYLEPIEKNYDKIYITDKYDQPYVILLFYLKYSPVIFQEEMILTPRDNYNFSTVKDFGNYHFEAIDWDLLKEEKDVLVIGTSEEIPKDAYIIKTIYSPNGKPAFLVAKL